MKSGAHLDPGPNSGPPPMRPAAMQTRRDAGGPPAHGLPNQKHPPFVRAAPTQRGTQRVHPQTATMRFQPPLGISPGPIHIYSETPQPPAQSRPAISRRLQSNLPAEERRTATENHAAAAAKWMRIHEGASTGRQGSTGQPSQIPVAHRGILAPHMPGTQARWLSHSTEEIKPQGSTRIVQGRPIEMLAFRVTCLMPSCGVTSMAQQNSSILCPCGMARSPSASFLRGRPGAPSRGLVRSKRQACHMPAPLQTQASPLPLRSPVSSFPIRRAKLCLAGAAPTSPPPPPPPPSLFSNAPELHA